MLTRIDFNAMVRSVMAELGHWRKPKTLEDAKLLGPVASQAPAPQMKRPNKSRLAQPDLLAALGVLLQLTKEVGGNYLASLQADVTSVEQSERSAGRVVVYGPQTTRADGPRSALRVYQAADQTLSIMSNRPFVRTTNHLPHEMGPLQ
jgi:hypothetical protein